MTAVFLRASVFPASGGDHGEVRLPLGLEYAPVADRVALFYERFPSGRITTQLVMHNEREIVFRASVYRNEHSRAPSATGWASEPWGHPGPGRPP